MKPPKDYPETIASYTCETCGTYDSNLKQGMCSWCHCHFNVVPYRPSLFTRFINFFKRLFK